MLKKNNSHISRMPYKAAILGALTLPGFALAQTLEDVLITIGDLLNILIPILITLALIFFFWGLAKYILAAGDEGAKAEGRNIMIYGIIALFVIVAVWGLVQVLINTFLGGSSPANPAVIPGVQ